MRRALVWGAAWYLTTLSIRSALWDVPDQGVDLPICVFEGLLGSSVLLLFLVTISADLPICSATAKSIPRGQSCHAVDGGCSCLRGTGMVGRRTEFSRGRLAAVGLFALLALAMTILPLNSAPGAELHVPDFRDDLTFRFQFTSATWQAIIWASLIALVASVLPWGKYAFAVGISVLVTFSIANSLHLQSAGGPLNSYLDFRRDWRYFVQRRR